MAERADAESGDIAGQRAAGRTGRNRRSRGLSRRARLNARRYYRRHVRDQRGRYHAGFLAHLLARGELQVLPRRVGRRYHLPPFVELYDIRFFRVAKQFFWQSALAAAAMLAIATMTASLHIGASNLRVWAPLALLLAATLIAFGLAHESARQVVTVVLVADAVAFVYLLVEAALLTRRAPAPA